jgi:hypothetical protein
MQDVIAGSGFILIFIVSMALIIKDVREKL